MTSRDQRRGRVIDPFEVWSMGMPEFKSKKEGSPMKPPPSVFFQRGDHP
jgi:hypothetical protein